MMVWISPAMANEPMSLINRLASWLVLRRDKRDHQSSGPPDAVLSGVGRAGLLGRRGAERAVPVVQAFR